MANGLTHMGDNTVMCIGGNTMKKLLFGTMLLALVIVSSSSNHGTGRYKH